MVFKQLDDELTRIIEQRDNFSNKLLALKKEYDDLLDDTYQCFQDLKIEYMVLCEEVDIIKEQVKSLLKMIES